MTFENPIIFFLSSLGVFNGFLVSMYFLFLEKRKRTQNRLFGFLVLMLTIRIGKSVYSLFSETKDLLIMQIGLSACFLIGVSLFYYLKSSVENRKNIPTTWKIHLLSLLSMVVIVGIIKPYRSNIEFWRSFVIFIYTVWGAYILISAYILKNIFLKIFNKEVKCTTSELWLVAVFIGNLLIYLAYLIGYFWLYLIGTLTFSVVFYGLFFFFMFKKNRETIFKDIPKKYESKKIETHEAERLITKLHEAMKQKQFHRNTNIKLNDIALHLHISSHKLSQLLNDNLGKSFALFINECRIEEAKKLLKENNTFTLEAIGFEAGFSSKSTFYATFKKIVGQTPSEYKKLYS
ncbi:helix-turn-helix domain-containing protein [Flavobacteriaceae bacterium S356]|uniref:Helix-turn-helix domain-containing protein n=1 Tax=Asprobacillus argus TaxID=3076534 RepID=A0ABU3LFP6_9FLAO|nr:helix-turn-helix domain-containing protein [Flavobacteriaceae bacterium S356]